MGMIQCSCPSCQLALNLGEMLAGRQLKCPRCSAAVVVPTPSVPEPVQAVPFEAVPLPSALPVASGAEPTFAETKQASPWSFGADGVGDYEGVAVSPEDMAGWRRVCKGLRRFLTGLMIFAAAVLARAALVAIAVLVAVAIRSDRSTSGLPFVDGCDLLISLSILVSWAFALVGLVEALHVPSSSGCRPFVLVALSSLGGAILLMLLSFLARFGAWVDYSSPQADQSSALVVVVGLLTITAWITTTVTMLLFVHRIGTLLQSAPLCKQVWWFAGIWGIGAGLSAVCYVGVLVAAGGLGSRSSGLALVLVVLLGLLAIATFLFVLARYSTLIGLALQAIDRKGITS